MLTQALKAPIMNRDDTKQNLQVPPLVGHPSAHLPRRNVSATFRPAGGPVGLKEVE
jgi:hypothetical protein